MGHTFTCIVFLSIATAIVLVGAAAESEEDRALLTPKPPDAPRINGPRVYGVRPGAPFLFRIPATGVRPMTFSAGPLPDRLSLDANTGIISGRIANAEKKTYSISLRAENRHGNASRDFRIVVGDTLALTPPMGWNHWYAHYDRVTDTMVRDAADSMVSSGMADVGYQYVNIDDCWMNAPKNNDPQRIGPLRDADGNIVPNAHFPDMRQLTDYIHAKGLKAGIYTSPGPLTCGGFAGSYEHEAQDAKQFVGWGFDFLRYDWCSYDRIATVKSLAELKKPYQVMSANLRSQPRDIVFNLSQYGMGDVGAWGEKVGGDCWRTAGDLGFELTQYHDVALKNAAHAGNARPGAWNDPDYIQKGLLNAEDRRFIEGICVAVMDACRVRPHEKVGNIGPNITGGTLVRPGGRNSYPAFWIRDYAMSLDSGLVTTDEQRHMLLLTATHQQDTEWRLANGSVVTPGSIPDHISLGNKPIFYPGALEDYEGQGGPRWGILPSLDDAYFFIEMAHCYVTHTNDRAILTKEVRGKPMIQRLEEAYRMPPSRHGTGLVYADDSNRGVTFGFVDTIFHTGDLLFCSLLKFHAADRLADLLDRMERPADAAQYREEAERIRSAIETTFALENGFYRASTGLSGQPDVWGTAYGVYIGAFDPPRIQATCEALAKAYRSGTLAWRGNIRHVLTSDDFSGATAWEKTDVAKNRYQNGAYWGTPTGWVCYAIAKVDWPAAQRLASEYVQELRDGDFRKGPEFGSPWECMHPGASHKQNPVYLASVSVPKAAFERIDRERMRK